MEAVNISTTQVLKQITVSKTRFSRYKEYQDNNWPLPALPYFMQKDEASGGMVIQTDEQRVLSGTYYTGSPPRTIEFWKEPLGTLESLYTVPLASLESQTADLITNRQNKLLDKIKAQSLPLIMMYRERHRTGKLVLKFLDDCIFFAANFRHPKRILNRYGYQHSVNNVMLARLKRIGKNKNLSVGEKWLEYRFAWTPLYHDIKDSFAAAEKAEAKYSSFRQQAGLPFEYKYSKTVDGKTSYGTRKGSYKIAVNYAVNDLTLAGVSMLMDVPTALWDGVPWSFVIDRIADVSSFLDRQNATLGTSFTSGYETLFYEQTIGFSKTAVSHQLFQKWNYGNYSSMDSIVTTTDMRPPRSRLYLKRTVLTQYPKPTLEFELFDVKAAHIIDYISLIKQRFSRKG